MRCPGQVVHEARHEEEVLILHLPDGIHQVNLGHRSNPAQQSPATAGEAELDPAGISFRSVAGNQTAVHQALDHNRHGALVSQGALGQFVQGVGRSV
jgi:hypothetical protein